MRTASNKARIRAGESTLFRENHMKPKKILQTICRAGSTWSQADRTRHQDCGGSLTIPRNSHNHRVCQNEIRSRQSGDAGCGRATPPSCQPSVRSEPLPHTSSVRVHPAVNSAAACPCAHTPHAPSHRCGPRSVGSSPSDTSPRAGWCYGSGGNRNFSPASWSC